MDAINWKRTVVAGLVTGAVLNVGEFVVEPLMGPQMEDFFKRLGLSVPGEAAMLPLAISALALGVLSIWLYAAILPRYGAGLMTATIAGAAVWALSCLLPNIVMLAFGLYTTRLFWLATIWPLVETVVAVAIGSRIYRERSGAIAAAAPA